MEKVTLTKIYTTDKDKQDNPLKSKDGKPYTRMSIKTQEHGDKWISGFQNSVNKNWKEGDEVEVTIKQNGEYLNFETPKKDDKVVEMLSQVLTRLGAMNAKIDYLAEKIYPREQALKDSNKLSDYPDEPINPEDIPF